MRGIYTKRKAIILFLLAGILAISIFAFSASAENNSSDDEELISFSLSDSAVIEEDLNSEGNENLLYNGDFEIIDEDGLPEAWYTDEYYRDSEKTVFSAPEDDASGRGTVVEIWNQESNDARFLQYVPVEPETTYCLSGYIWAEGISGGHGANFSIEDVYTFSEEVFDTDGDWKYVEFYGKTGPGQDILTVFVRLGGYGGESTGKARFDQINLRKADNEVTMEVPDWYISGMYENNDSDSDDTENPYQYAQTDSDENSRLFLILTGTGWCVLFLLFATYFRGRKRPRLVSSNRERYYFIPILIFAFAARLIISYWVEGYMVDVNCFSSWGGTMDAYGPLKFYQKTSYCDYPPLYTYILSLNSVIVRWTGATDGWTRLIFRLFPSVCDIMSCWLLYRYAKEKMPEQINRVCVILLFFAFNPAVILNSAAWGQIDSVLCLLLLSVAFCAVKGKWQAALPFYAISVLLKPQALMLGILGLVYIIITWIRKKECRKPMVIGFICALAATAIIILPFGVNQSFGWLIEKYKETLKSYPYATINTANFYYLLGGNWAKIQNNCNQAGPAILAVSCITYGVWWYFRNKKRPYVWVESILSFDFAFLFTVLAVMHATWSTVGTVAMIYAFVVTISLAIRKQDIHFLPYLGALLFILLYVFGVKMHERYIFPALFLLTGAWVIQRDRRILYVLAIFTLTLFVNEGIVLDNSIRFGSSYGHLLSDTVVLADILSVINIIGSVYALCIGSSMVYGNEADGIKYTDPVSFPDKIPGKRSPLNYHTDRSLHWNWKDTCILSAVTVAFSVVSLTTLGSTKAPQNGWTSSGSDEEIIFDLGENHEAAAILYFGRVSISEYSDFTFSESNDLTNWYDEIYAQMNYGECWKWKYAVSSYGTGRERSYNQSLSGIHYFTGRYIKLSAQNYGLRLNEIIFRDQSGNRIPARVYQRTGGNTESTLYSDPANLLDEQDTLEALPDLVNRKNGDNQGAQPSWWNSTYFDEIYHARTGFEFLHPDEIRYTEPYENSHPPLGKILISISIAVFGMTPFGWRFAGALAGILMIPGMYLLGKQLTKKTSIASIAAILISLDCMHLTQTQIATIDSFPVLFIIFAYFFMLRFIQTDFVQLPLRKSLFALAMCGLFMGLSIASKWIGIYAGAGLAVLFFWHIFRMIRISREARTLSENPSVTPAEKEYLSQYTGTNGNGQLPVFGKVLWICHWCIVFFVVIPIGIYLLSYIPFMVKRTDIHSFGDYLSAVWNSQLGMLNYHSKPGLGMDHPFYSPWYEWPMILKPMYYAARQYLSATTTVPFSIYCIGNPVIWWSAIPALIYCVLSWIKTHFYQVSLGYDLPSSRKKMFRPVISLPCHITARSYDNRISFILIGLLAQYLPWVLVPRGTYIYHYFASVPFMILCIVMVFDKLYEENRIYFCIFALLLVLCALAAFIIFFPYASGIAVSRSWLDIGNKVLRITY